MNETIDTRNLPSAIFFVFFVCRTYSFAIQGPMIVIDSAVSESIINELAKMRYTLQQKHLEFYDVAAQFLANLFCRFGSTTSVATCCSMIQHLLFTKDVFLWKTAKVTSIGAFMFSSRQLLTFS
jgi:hypothetical protein